MHQKFMFQQNHCDVFLAQININFIKSILEYSLKCYIKIYTKYNSYLIAIYINHLILEKQSIYLKL